MAGRQTSLNIEELKNLREITAQILWLKLDKSLFALCSFLFVKKMRHRM